MRDATPNAHVDIATDEDVTITTHDDVSRNSCNIPLRAQNLWRSTTFVFVPFSISHTVARSAPPNAARKVSFLGTRVLIIALRVRQKFRTVCEMVAKKSSSPLADAFLSTPQGRVSVMIALIYTGSTFLFGLCPGHIAAGLLKLAVLAYTINCMVAGNCRTLGWVHVMALAIFCAADMAGLVHMDRGLQLSGTHGLFGARQSKTYADARANMDKA